MKNKKRVGTLDNELYTQVIINFAHTRGKHAHHVFPVLPSLNTTQALKYFN